MRNDTSPQAVQSCHELLLWLIPQLDKLPRSRRFTLGDRLERVLLDVLEKLVDAAYSPVNVKKPLLARANLRLEMARHLWRLCHELKLISTRRYQYGAKLMDELGRQVGGWLRSSSKFRQ